MLVAWNPAAYLFEANMIVYQYSAPVVRDEDDEDSEDDADLDGEMNLIRKRDRDRASLPVSAGNKGQNKDK
jgi:hypothetical protein